MSEVPEQPETGPSILVAAGLVYGGFCAAGYLWLWGRDRTSIIPPAAVGEVGLVGSMALGLAVGLGASAVFALLVRYSVWGKRLQSRLAELIGPLSEREITWLALLSAVGEEFFFRLAMQDALGLYWSAALFGALHCGPRGLLLWTALAFALGLAFGWMMQAGWGLLSVSVAHALINYLSLRRMERA